MPQVETTSFRQGKRRIVDAHFHLIDHTENQYPFLEQVDDMFEALIGDYSSLPRTYVLADYLREAESVDVCGLVWHEMISSDPLREVTWAQGITDTAGVPMSLVGIVDFAAPDLEDRLNAYSQCKNLVSVREHLGWDAKNPLRRFAKRPGLLMDPAWQLGLKTLKRYGYRCSLEVFSSQLPDLLSVIQANPDIGFAVAVMGWPEATDETTFAHWRSSIAALSRCENATLVISAVECVFGMAWSVAEALPWVRVIFETFGPERSMFGSHRPISGLALRYGPLFEAYGALAGELSVSEQDAVFRGTAAEWFRIPAARR